MATTPPDRSPTSLRGGPWPEGAEAILEPSAGDGAFVEAVARRLGRRGRIDAIELHEDEASKIRARVPTANVADGDAFTWYSVDRDGTYDAVVGNPPFIRYQTFPEAHRAAGFALMHLEGLRPNRLTNAWVPFVVLATRALRPGGRLAMVVPAELLQVTYASELRAVSRTQLQRVDGHHLPPTRVRRHPTGDGPPAWHSECFREGGVDVLHGVGPRRGPHG